MRDVLLFLHITGVAGWLGGGMFAIFTFNHMARQGDTAAAPFMESILKKAAWVFVPASTLVLITGISMVLTQNAWGWTDTFVLIGIGAFVGSGIVQAVAADKNDKALIEAVRSGDGSVLPALRRFLLSASVDYLILFVALWAMVTKLGAG